MPSQPVENDELCVEEQALLPQALPPHAASRCQKGGCWCLLLLLCGLGLLGLAGPASPAGRAQTSALGALSQKIPRTIGARLQKREFHIRWTVASNLCLDVPYARAYENQIVQTYRCRPQDSAQLWVSLGGQIAFSRSFDPGLCLTRDGRTVKLRTCTMSPDQNVKVVMHGYAEKSTVHLKHEDGKCLQVKGSVQKEHQLLEYGDCDVWRGDQLFAFWAVESPIKWVYGQNKCFQVDGSQPEGLKNGLPVELWECKPGDKQQMFVYDLGDSNRIHVGMDPNYCLDFNHNAKPWWADDMAYPLQVWFCGDYRSQTFWKRPAERTTLRNDETKLCMDVFEGGDYNGNKIQAWTCTDGSKNQYFDFAAGPVDFSAVFDKQHSEGPKANEGNAQL